MLRAAFYTLGCKLNQLETESVAGAFEREGFSLADPREEADLFVINTCTVTSHSEQKARRIIRGALAENPGAAVIVTGCYAQLEGERLAALESPAGASPEGAPGRRLFVVPGAAKERLLELPGFLRRAGQRVPAALPAALPERLPALLAAWIKALPLRGPPEASVPGEGFRFRPPDGSFRSRAFMKIQDGCGGACTYCRVRLARGKSRSLEAEKALALLRDLEDRGYTEAVLTGVNLSQYRDGGRDLGGLLDLLLRGTRTIRLRLSSLEPGCCSPEFCGVLAHRRIRAHFHLSLQSGSPGVLERMGRSYGPPEAEEAVRRFRAVKDDPFLACDIIAGFPGETPEDFEKTLALCGRLDFAWIHAFPYSPRPGTPAWHFKAPVPQGEAGRRVGELTALARRGRAAYIKRWRGRETEAVIQKNPSVPPGFSSGVSDNYLRLLISGAGDPPGSLVRCRISPGEPDVPPGARFDAWAEKTG
ncbi:MAG: tRNA (N(6)-L-threonylcarbamoyladenosine(37)-C(2))-methylthiotransferase MtaB [Spirochaetaceae bacterium]|jgi:threonylcarbamoyladenosine tRNA methylthiotransferase MtaB|nr:tRNA (N(6)-L-threonylcarbamoyladenosine(37)-C(2))-methylthiotransferase MtaB [Spirochaetaceae bacterium]